MQGYFREKDGVKLLIVKGFLFIAVLIFAFWDEQLLVKIFTQRILSFRLYHLLWFIWVGVIIKRFIPSLNKKVTLGKIFRRNYFEADKDSEAKRARLIAYKRKMDRGAIRCAIYWSMLIIVIGVFHYLDILNKIWLFITVLFFIFMDQFCVTIWCPFKAIIQNKCCNTCRINNWSNFMALSPLIFVQSFWTYSLLFLSLLSIFQWEYLFNSHPERFYEAYNTGLMCKNCIKGCYRNTPSVQVTMENRFIEKAIE